MTLSLRAAALAVLLLAGWPAERPAQCQGAPGQYLVSEPGSAQPPWPRQASSGGYMLTVYQPQVESWTGDTLTARAAVSISTPASAAPVYGVVWFAARTEVDKAAGTVTLDDIRITRTRLPRSPAGAPSYASLLHRDVPDVARTVPLQQIEAALAVTQAESAQRHQPLDNAPPKIYYSTRPALLVLVDGDPAFRATSAARVDRIINTRALLLLDRTSGIYYLYVMDRWMRAPSLGGPWTEALRPPDGINPVEHQLASQGSVDLLSNPPPAVEQALNNDQPVAIYVSTVPAELIDTDGIPNWQQISGTHLLWAQNTHNSLFTDAASQRYYVLLAGRWYMSPSLANGPWSFVPGPDLPHDFARIPETSPAGDALPSVPGTPEAAQARVANRIPQTAAVRRDAATLTVTYDGAPRFVPIEGTQMQYAVNTATPVVLVPGGQYYACSNAVWFVSSSSTGPWTAATAVPPIIYTIPVTCPINYVTNVQVYGCTPDVVYEGYTPGYLGAYLEPWDCVVFGSGYPYPAWIGNLWIGPPVTFGLGACFDFTPGFGWSFGFGLGMGPIWTPWWGPWAGYWHQHDHHPWVDHVGPWQWHDADLARYNVYNRWDHNVVMQRPRVPFRPQIARAGAVGRPLANDVFAGRNGQVYRREPAGWQVRQGNAWRPVGGLPGSAASAAIARSPTVARNGVMRPPLDQSTELYRQQQARELGLYRTNVARSAFGLPTVPGAPPMAAHVATPRLPPGVSAPRVAAPPRMPAFGGTFGGFGRRSAFGFGGPGGRR